jgi:hypothetical protein
MHNVDLGVFVIYIISSLSLFLFFPFRLLDYGSSLMRDDAAS